MLTDGQGNIIKTYEYDAFGVEWDAVDTDNNPFRYCGEYFDKETKTFYLRARYYDSAYGRFTQQDGWEYANHGDPLSLNLYTYCWNNPVNMVDPSGHFIGWLVAAVIVVGVVIGMSGCTPNDAEEPTVSGYEKEYEPDSWNDGDPIYDNRGMLVDGGEVQCSANCYAYALNRTDEFGNKLQPGDLSGKRYTEYNKGLGRNIVAACKADAEACGGYFSEKPPTSGEYYAVALVYGPIYINGRIVDYDYHWYRQNPDGTWSHKAGFSPVTNVDADGNIIDNPYTANRNYCNNGTGANYEEFVGFFYVGEVLMLNKSKGFIVLMIMGLTFSLFSCNAKTDKGYYDKSLSESDRRVLSQSVTMEMLTEVIGDIISIDDIGSGNYGYVAQCEKYGQVFLYGEYNKNIKSVEIRKCIVLPDQGHEYVLFDKTI